MSFHSIDQVRFSCAGFQVKYRVEGVNLKEVSVSTARRTGASIADPAEVGDTLCGPVGQILVRGDVLGQLLCIGRQIV